MPVSFAMVDFNDVCEFTGWLREQHREILAPNLDGSGIEHNKPIVFDSPFSFCSKVEWIMTTEDQGKIWADKEHKPSESVQVKLHSPSGGIPFRAEYDEISGAHINSLCEQDNHARIHFPADAIANFATAGSVLGMYFGTQDGKSAEQLLKNHFDEI